MQKIRLDDVVSNSECWDKTGRPPISTKWVRVNKGTQEVPDIRCRLVARDFKPTDRRIVAKSLQICHPLIKSVSASAGDDAERAEQIAR